MSFIKVLSFIGANLLAAAGVISLVESFWPELFALNKYLQVFSLFVLLIIFESRKSLTLNNIKRRFYYDFSWPKDQIFLGMTGALNQPERTRIRNFQYTGYNNSNYPIVCCDSYLRKVTDDIKYPVEIKIINNYSYSGITKIIPARAKFQISGVFSGVYEPSRFLEDVGGFQLFFCTEDKVVKIPFSIRKIKKIIESFEQPSMVSSDVDVA